MQTQTQAERTHVLPKWMEDSLITLKTHDSLALFTIGCQQQPVS